MRAGATLILLLTNMSRAREESPVRKIHAKKKKGSMRCRDLLLGSMSGAFLTA